MLREHALLHGPDCGTGGFAVAQAAINMSHKRRALFLCGNGVLSGQEGCRQPENEGIKEYSGNYCQHVGDVGFARNLPHAPGYTIGFKTNCVGFLQRSPQGRGFLLTACQYHAAQRARVGFGSRYGRR